DPRRGAMSSLALGAAILKRGDSLAWFPEGERARDGKLKPFRPGIGLMLHRYAVPVVPVAIRGTYEALPPGAFWLRPRQVVVRFGPPLEPGVLEREGEGEKPEERI